MNGATAGQFDDPMLASRPLNRPIRRPPIKPQPVGWAVEVRVEGAGSPVARFPPCASGPDASAGPSKCASRAPADPSPRAASPVSATAPSKPRSSCSNMRSSTHALAKAAPMRRRVPGLAHGLERLDVGAGPAARPGDDGNRRGIGKRRLMRSTQFAKGR